MTGCLVQPAGMGVPLEASLPAIVADPRLGLLLPWPAKPAVQVLRQPWRIHLLPPRHRHRHCHSW